MISLRFPIETFYVSDRRDRLSVSLLKAEDIHLWKIKPEEIKIYHEYPPYPYWYPYWWWYPYCW